MSRRSRHWQWISRRAKELAGWRCAECGSPGPLETHHRLPVSRGGRDDLENLIVLCLLCHLAAHGVGFRNRLPPGWRELVESL